MDAHGLDRWSWTIYAIARVNACPVTSGQWTSPYDGATWTSDADVDIDHVVPLAEAWRAGAADWDDSRRAAFANDLDGPQLIAVTDSVNLLEYARVHRV